MPHSTPTHRHHARAAGLLFALLPCHALAAQALCDHIWKDNTSVIRFPASISVPYVVDIGTVFQSALWQAPEASGLSNPNRAIMVCKTPGDIAFEFKADGYDNYEKDAARFPYYLPTRAGALIAKVTYGKGSAHETIMTYPSGKGRAVLTLPGAIPTHNERGEPLDGTAKPSGALLKDGTAKTYSVTINKLKAITPMNAMGELLKYADVGSAQDFGGYHRFTWYMKYAGATNPGQWSTVWSKFQFSKTQVTLAPCHPPQLPALIDLGSHPLKNFPASGAKYTSTPVPFQVQLNCPGMGKSGGVYYGFLTEHTYSSSQPDLLSSQLAAESANGIAVELLKSDGATRHPLLRPNDLSTNWQKSDISANKKTTTLAFHARVRQMENTVTAGLISSRATFLINFK